MLSFARSAILSRRWAAIQIRACSSTEWMRPKRDRVVSSWQVKDTKSIVQTTTRNPLYPGTDVPIEEAWRRRQMLRTPILQRDEALPVKAYYAPEWEIDEEKDPTKGFGITPEKWEYYNKVVWPPNYVVPETGLPKPREVFHCRQSIHCSPKRMWKACQFLLKMNVDDALVQLEFQHFRASKILEEVLKEAKNRAHNEFHIEFPGEMHIAEAFPVQEKIIKGFRIHAKYRICKIRYRYINVFVRLEEGDGPGYKSRNPMPDGWQKMENYYDYLRSRTVKYGL